MEINKPVSMMYFDFIVKDKINTVIEAGVFDGWTTINLANKLCSKVYSFEPCYSEYLKGYKGSKYHEKIAINPNIKVYPLGLYSHRTKLKFQKEEIFAHSRVVGSGGNCEIDTISIDEFVKENGIKVDYIKVDTEGSEMPILVGAKETILRDRPQLAIGAYHGWQQLIEIPVYLHNTLIDYVFNVANYSGKQCETILYCIPKELL